MNYANSMKLEATAVYDEREDLWRVIVSNTKYFSDGHCENITKPYEVSDCFDTEVFPCVVNEFNGFAYNNHEISPEDL